VSWSRVSARDEDDEVRVVRRQRPQQFDELGVAHRALRFAVHRLPQRVRAAVDP
jgi:hypothetical protein